MSTLPGRLGALTAHDVMTRDVITLTDTESIEAALAQLRSNHITGAPVIDADGKFVGILSLRDLLRSGAAMPSESGPDPIPLAHGEDQTTWDLFEQAIPVDEQTNIQSVSQRMSKRVTSVTEQTPVVEVARVMCHGHWHRVPVVNDGGTLCGIISTMDILAALVNVADEPG